MSSERAEYEPSALAAPIADTRGVVFDFGRVLSAELVGTAVLILCGPGSAILVPDFPGKLILVAFSFGLALMAMAYAVGPTSGAHLNPAVTLAMLVTNKVSRKHAAYAVVGQLIGGIGAAAALWGIARGRSGYQRGTFAANGWDRAFTDAGHVYGLGSVIVVEILFTAILVVVVLSTTRPRFTPGFGGLVAGLTLTLIHLVTIPIDGTSVNPVRSLSTAIFADADPNALAQLWAFIVFPLIGAMVGVVVWLLVDEARLEETMLDTDFLRATRDAADDVID